MHFLFLRKLTSPVFLVFKDSPFEVIGDPGVKHIVVLVGHDVNTILFFND